MEMGMNLGKLSKTSAWAFLGILTLLHLSDSDVDPSWQPISEYALGKYGWLMNIAFLLLGISMLSLGVLVLKNTKKLVGKIGAILCMASSIGSFLAAIYNTDPAGTLPENITPSGQIHVFSASLLGLLILSTIFITWLFFKESTLKPFRKKILRITGLVWFSEVVLIISIGLFLSKTNGVLEPTTPIGWQGRAVIVACAFWLIGCSTYFQRQSVRQID